MGADCLPSEIASVWDGRQTPHRGSDFRGRLEASLRSTLSNSSECVLQAWPEGGMSVAMLPAASVIKDGETQSCLQGAYSQQ